MTRCLSERTLGNEVALRRLGMYLINLGAAKATAYITAGWCEGMLTIQAGRQDYLQVLYLWLRSALMQKPQSHHLPTSLPSWTTAPPSPSAANTKHGPIPNNPHHPHTNLHPHRKSLDLPLRPLRILHSLSARLRRRRR